MKKMIFFTLLTITLVCNYIYAEDTKTKDINKTMTDEEFMKEFMRLDNNIEIKKGKNEELKILNNTLDKALDLVNTKK